MAITDSWLTANHKKPRTKAIAKTDRDGLNARVLPKGKITYSLEDAFKTKSLIVVLGVRAPLAIPYNILQYLRRHENYEMPHFSMHHLL